VILLALALLPDPKALASPAYRVRAAETARLTRLGPAAAQLVLPLRTHRNPEVRHRARAIWDHAALVRWPADVPFPSYQSLAASAPKALGLSGRPGDRLADWMQSHLYDGFRAANACYDDLPGLDDRQRAYAAHVLDTSVRWGLPPRLAQRWADRAAERERPPPPRRPVPERTP
jgi:hypothetical protein